MARPLILHIGLPKTGSTSIQRVMSSHREALGRLGVHYMRSPGLLHHGLLPAALVNDRQVLGGFNPTAWEGASAAARLERFAAEWRAELASLPGGTQRCVISSEMIASLLRAEDEVGRLADWLRPHFDPIQIVVYLRRQDRQAASAYSQSLRSGVLRPPGLPAGGPAHHWMLDYAGLLERYASAFGEAALCPRIFERGRLYRGDVIDDFLHIAGLDLHLDANAPARVSNPSLRRDGQALLLMLGEAMEARAPGAPWRTGAAWQRLAELISQALPGPGWLPAREEARAFVARFAAGNEAVRRRFFTANETLFTDDFSDLPHEDQPISSEILVTACIDALIHSGLSGCEREAGAALSAFRIARRLNDVGEMQTLLDQAVQWAPFSLEIRLRAAKFSLNYGAAAQAADHAAAALQIDPHCEAAQLLQQKAMRKAARLRHARVNLTPSVARQ